MTQPDWQLVSEDGPADFCQFAPGSSFIQVHGWPGKRGAISPAPDRHVLSKIFVYIVPCCKDKSLPRGVYSLYIARKNRCKENGGK